MKTDTTNFEVTMSLEILIAGLVVLCIFGVKFPGFFQRMLGE